MEGQEYTNNNPNQMSDEIFDRLKQFISEQGLGYTLPWPLVFKKKEIKRETTIEKDLGITGDDSEEFLIEFGKEFNVDVSKFPIGDYFDDEGDPILPAIIRMFTGKRKRQIKELKIGQLEKAVIAGRLDEKVINS